MRILLTLLISVVTLTAHTFALPRDKAPREFEKRAATDSFSGSPSLNSVSSGSSVFKIPLQLGCAAALLCVEEQFCTMDGTISVEPVALTSRQLLRRVPLSSCRNPETGIIGKCCRDPNYVDPWPTGNLPVNYTGGFDEQGFPTFLNVQKVQPPRKPTTKAPTTTTTTAAPSVIELQGGAIAESEASSVADQFLQIPEEVQQTPEQVQQIPEQVQQIPEQAHQIPEQVHQIPEQVHQIPEQVHQIPEIIQFPVQQETINFLPEIPLVPDTSGPAPELVPLPEQIPQILSIFPSPQPFSKNNYDDAPSNQSPALIATAAPPAQCGIKNNIPRPTVLSDFETAFGEIPWQAMVLWNPGRRILCSGAIVAPNAVLTAASCVDKFQPREISVKAGEWKLGYELKHEEPLPFEIMNVASIAVNPHYATGSPSNDSAILLLEHPVPFNVHINTLCVPEVPHVQETRDCIVTGWGKTVLQVNVAGAVMHSIDVDVLPQDVCTERVTAADSHMHIDQNVICVKSHQRNNNMCQTDIGSPLACRTASGAYELLGIYSQDTGCLPTNQVAAFSHIDTVWLKSTLQPPSPTEINLGIDISPPVYSPEQDPSPDGRKEVYDYRKSNLPPDSNKYLPPV